MKRWLATASLLGLLLFSATFPESARSEDSAVSPPTVAIPTETPLPLLTGERWNDEIFGAHRGYFHPFLSLTEYYTDNLFDLPENEEEEFITVLSPGFWLAYPGSNRQTLQVLTLNAAPGGLAVTRLPVEARQRFQAYALYRADIKKHDNFPDEDKVYQRAEGLLNVNLRGGLSLELLDIFQISQDPYSVGTDRELDRITSNLVQFLANYRLGPKTRVRADYTRYSVLFDDDRNAFRERDDDVASLFLFYRFLPRTSLLLEFDYIEIDYRQETLADSREKTVFAGLRWDGSEKTEGLAKFGHSWRDIDEGGSREAFIGEIRLDYRFTPKTTAFFAITRRVEETDVVDTNSVFTHRAQLGYRQKIATRWSATADLFYFKSDYRGVTTVRNGSGMSETGHRLDDNFGGRLAAGYLFRRWLNCGIGYDIIRRNSNFDDLDYTSNTVFLTATAAF